MIHRIIKNHQQKEVHLVWENLFFYAINPKKYIEAVFRNGDP